MRKEYIEYTAEVPVNLTLATVENYPIHWHDSIEIIYVLKGSAKVTIDSEAYELEEGELEIINVDEAHRLFSKDKSNKILIFHINPYFFEKYYSDMKNMFFYTNTSDEGAQEKEEYQELRTLLSMILCEAVQRQENFDEEIKQNLVKLLYHLINNFHYLVYDKEELKENEEQLERYHRIARYIFNNYNSNITLQDIANEEYLSTHYLSHEIKYATGYSFTDLLNITRVDESIKLLLDSDKPISEIAEDVGFSHIRYYNKHFKLHYKCSPLQFRKKHKVSEEVYEKQKKVTYHDLAECIEYLTYYLEDYDRFNYEDKIVKLNLDMSEDRGEFEKGFKRIINAGDAFDLLIEDNKDILEELQYDIGFEYARLLNLLSPDMGVFPGAGFYNWSRALSVLEFLSDIGLKPLIVLDSSFYEESQFKKAVKSFLDYFSEIDGFRLRDISFQLSEKIHAGLKEELIKLLEEQELSLEEGDYKDTNSINLVHDTAYMLPFILHNALMSYQKLDFLRAFDVLDKQVNPTNEVFFGYSGLINDKGIKKPSYYAYYLLNKLGGTLVAMDNGYVVTKGEGEYQILLYNYNETLEELLDFRSILKLRGSRDTAERKLSLNITNLGAEVRITTYEINERTGSSYNYWVEMGRPKRLNKAEEEILQKASFPQIHFNYSKKSTVLNLQPHIRGYGAVLIIIQEVQ